jgi:Protein of unknown function (DUF998)
MAACREHTWVLAMTTSGRSSAILHIKKRPSCKGFDMVQAHTRDGYDPTRHDRSLLANDPDGWIQIASFVLMWLLVIAVAALTYHQPSDPRARSNQ